VAERLAPLFGVAPADVLRSALTLIGSAEQIAERFEERRARWGCSYHVIPGGEAHAFAPIVAELAGR
jgi:hypothetical protein